MKLKHLYKSVSALSMLALAACVSIDVAPIQANEKPTEVDEKGMWYAVDKHERWLQTSGMIERDPELNAYVREVVCDITGEEYCKDLRIYVVDQPYFNATMSPNGMMQIWTGLLLRADTEAQMAFVIGHEFVHYRQRHSLSSYRNTKNVSAMATIAGLGLGLAGEGIAARLSQFAALAHLYGYSRDHEREADTMGFVSATDAGYNPFAGEQIWQKLTDEIGSSDSRRKKRRYARSSLFNTHPITTERIKTLGDMARISGKSGKDNADRLNQARARFMEKWLEEDLVRRNYGESLFLINSLLQQREVPPQTAIGAEAILAQESAAQVGMLYFRRGEIYRLRREDGDNDLALQDYQTAAKYSDTPAENWRAMGDMYRKQGNGQAAVSAWQQYLDKNPDATDRLLIEKYIAEGGAS